MRRLRIALDFNCSPRLVGALDALYGDRGFSFFHLQKFVVGRTEDEIWADAIKRFGGCIVLSGDSRIAHKLHLAVAFIDNGLLSFFPSEGWNQLKAHQKSASFIHAWPMIEAKILENQYGSCWRFACQIVQKDDGKEVRLNNEPLQQLKIPDEVLNRTRKQLQGRR